MSASFYLHIKTWAITENDLKIALGGNNLSASTIKEVNKAYNKINHTPCVYIGDVSWLKAALLEDIKYIPSSIEKISNIFHNQDGICVILTDEIIIEITEALLLPNDSDYTLGNNVNKKMKRFLKNHRGQEAFVVTH